MSDRPSTQLIQAARLFQNVSKNGATYWTGRWGNLKVVIFENRQHNPEDPQQNHTHNLMLGEAAPYVPKPQTANGSSHVTPSLPLPQPDTRHAGRTIGLKSPPRAGSALSLSTTHCRSDRTIMTAIPFLQPHEIRAALAADAEEDAMALQRERDAKLAHAQGVEAAALAAEAEAQAAIVAEFSEAEPPDNIAAAEGLPPQRGRLERYQQWLAPSPPAGQHPNAKSIVGQVDRRASAAAAKADQLARYRTRSVPDPAVAAARQAKAEQQAVREAEKRIARNAAIAAIEVENRAAKQRKLDDVAAASALLIQRVQDEMVLAAQAAADADALVAHRKAARDERYRNRAARAKTSRAR